MHHLCLNTLHSRLGAVMHSPSESTAYRGVDGSIIHLILRAERQLEVLPSLRFIAIAIIVTYSKHVQNFLPSVVRTEFAANLACS